MDTIKYPIKFCIFYNLMRDLCVRTFLFFGTRNIIQKRKKITHTHAAEFGATARGALRVFPTLKIKKRVKK